MQRTKPGHHFGLQRIKLKQGFLLACIITYSVLLRSQPVISSFTPVAAPVGASVTINGSNFNAAAAGNIVYFGAVRAAVTTATTTSLTVTVPLRATPGFITVTTNNNTAYSAVPFHLSSGTTLTPMSYVMRWGFGVTGNFPSALAVTDLNNDGRPDLIGANFNSDNLSIFQSASFSGTVQMLSEAKWATGIKPEGLASGDVNSDGKTDLVVTSIDDHLISIFINTSAGSISFAPRVDISAGALNWPRGVAIHDVDGDAKPDLVVADNNKIYSNNNSYSTVSVYRNTSAGNLVSFAAPIILQAGEYTRKIGIADLDGDRKPDIAVTNNTVGSVSVFKNNSTPGAIAFSTSQVYNTGNYPEQVVLSDVTGDGKADMAVSNYGSSTISLFKNTSVGGAISFGPKQDISTVSPLGIAIGDVSGDGKPDLVAASYSTDKISVFSNSSSGNNISFAPKIDYNSGSRPLQVAIGDMDGDGLPDVSLTNSTTNFISVLRLEAGSLSVNLGNDAALCQGDSLVLTANVSNVQYLWSTGSTANSITVKQPGSYWVKVSSGGNVASDTVSVSFSPKPVFNLGPDATLCEGQKIVLKPGISSASYLWQDGSTTDSMVVTKNGSFWLYLEKGGCSASDTLNAFFKQAPTINLGTDKTLCPDSSIVLSAFDPSVTSYSWQDNTEQPQIIVNKAGTYLVKVTGSNGCSSSDTVLIQDSPIARISLGGDTTLCEQAMLNYEFDIAGASYLWNNGSSINSFSIGSAGTYWLQLSLDGCIKRDTVTVAFASAPAVHLGKDTTLCEGSIKVLDVFNANTSYLWSTGATGASITVSTKGTYWVAANHLGCIVRDTVRVNYINSPRVLLNADTLLCEGQSLNLTPQVSDGSLQWQDGSTGLSYTVTQPGIYKVTATNSCGTGNAEITIRNGLCELLMPNAFTPNNNGLNDVFRVKYPGFIKSFRMQIFNRWGQKIYDSSDPYQGWDGKQAGALLPTGNYVWTIWLTDNNGNKRQYKGSVMLIR